MWVQSVPVRNFGTQFSSLSFGHAPGEVLHTVLRMGAVVPGCCLFGP